MLKCRQVEDWRQITKLENEQEAHVSATQAIEKFAILQKPKSRYDKWAFDVLQAKRRYKEGIVALV